MKNKGMLALGCVVLLGGCSTEVELNAEWKDTTIIYGLLDSKDNIHYVKINKAFLGSGNAYDMALIQDSSEYQNVSAVVEELSGSTVLRSWTLKDTLLNDRNPSGIFYSPTYKAYYFTESALNDSYTYQVRVTVQDEGGKEVSATTPLVKPFSISSPITTFGFAASAVGSGNQTYYSPGVVWSQSQNGVAYELLLVLKYDEYTTTTTTRKALVWNRGNFDPGELSAGSNFNEPVSGEAFYKFLADNIANDPNVTKRVFRAIDVMVYAASEELDTYMQLTAPSTGIVQERPEYTNVVNGIGLFSSRVHVVAKNKYISKFSMHELCEGTYTFIQKDLKFCSDSTVYMAESYYCP